MPRLPAVAAGGAEVAGVTMPTDPARTIVIARTQDGRELDRWPANDPLASARLKALLMEWDYVSLEGEEQVQLSKNL